MIGRFIPLLQSWCLLSYLSEVSAIEAFSGVMIVPLHYGDSHPGSGRISALSLPCELFERGWHACAGELYLVHGRYGSRKVDLSFSFFKSYL